MRLQTALIAGAAVAVVAAAGALTHKTWRGWFTPAPAAAGEEGHKAHGDAPPQALVLSEEAMNSLGLKAGPLERTAYTRSLELPGEVVELPGRSDRAVTAPVAGVVERVHHAPWQTVEPGAKLFTLRLVSELLQTSQAALYRAENDLKGVRERQALLDPGVKTGAVSQGRVLELQLEAKRLEASIESHRFLLGSFGLRPEQIARAAAGKFITHIDVFAPARPAEQTTQTLEVQELKVNFGEQVRPGQALCYLTDHQHLAIEGHAFRGELALLEDVARRGTPIRAEWPEGERGDWPAYAEGLRVRNLANVIDGPSQTFPFYVPLVNQSRDYRHDGQSFRLWRYRPGQRVRLLVPAKRYVGVFVLPREAVVREGAEHYVFRQNSDAFERKAVTVLFEGRTEVVISGGDGIDEGHFVALNRAATLNRALLTRPEEGGDEHGHDHHHHHH